MKWFDRCTLPIVFAACLGQTPDADYEKLKAGIVAKFQNASPGKFGPFVKGVVEDIITDEKILALTFDACGGRMENDYDQELVDWLRGQKIQATLFYWRFCGSTPIPILFMNWPRIPCLKLRIMDSGIILVRSNGQSIYGIRGTENPGQAVDEIELNARKISAGHPPEARLLPLGNGFIGRGMRTDRPGSWGSRSLVMMCFLATLSPELRRK